MAERFSDVNIRRLENGNIEFSNTQKQVFKPEDFVQVYEDTKNSRKTLEQQIEQYENKREDILDEHGEDLAAIHYILGLEGSNPPQELEGAASDEALQKRSELVQIKEQLSQMRQRKEQVMEQEEEMRELAENIKESLEKKQEGEEE